MVGVDASGFQQGEGSFSMGRSSESVAFLSVEDSARGSLIQHPTRTERQALGGHPG